MGILSVLRNRSYTVFVAGASVGTIGNWIQTGALTWYVSENTGSNAMVGATNLMACLPAILLILFAGALADRMNRKKLIIINQVCMMLGALALAVSTSFGWPTIGVIFAIVLITGISTALNTPAWQAVIPDLLSKEDVLHGVTLNNLLKRVARFIGLFLGGLVLSTWSASTAFYFNAASYLFVVVAVASIGREAAPAPQPSWKTLAPLADQVAEGWRYIRRFEWAKVTISILGAICLFGASTTVLLPSLTTDVLGRSASAYSWLWSSAALGSFIGVVALTILARRYHGKALLKISSMLFGPLLLGVCFSRSYPVTIALMAGLGGSFLMLNSTVVAVLDTHTDPDMRGIVLAFYSLAQTAGFSVGGQLVGLLADAISTPWAFFVCGSICTMLALVFILFPRHIVDSLSIRAAKT
ncbi:MAG: MFS transporter [Actinomycetota bacterium]|nr:MFS transporter [Actinomycetota bacterium]